MCCTYAQDYDFEARSRPAPARIQPGYSGNVDTKPTPVPILKQINRHNEDGSYTYGYEGADGSFKIETKSQSGDVKGKYGYVDADGKLRTVEYGADKFGFQPAGEGITVPPPTLVDESLNKNNNLVQEDEEPQQYFQPAPRPQSRPAAARPPQHQQQYQDFSVPQQASPVPQRPLAIPGAQPAGITYSERPQSYNPPPQQKYRAPANPERFAPQFASARPVQFEEPAPVHQTFDDFQFNGFSSQQQQPQRQAPPPQQQPIHYAQLPVQQQQRSAPRSSGGSILDQLAKDYALPSNGAPALHDITFGANYY